MLVLRHCAKLVPASTVMAYSREKETIEARLLFIISAIKQSHKNRNTHVHTTHKPQVLPAISEYPYSPKMSVWGHVVVSLWQEEGGRSRGGKESEQIIVILIK